MNTPNVQDSVASHDNRLLLYVIRRLSLNRLSTFRTLEFVIASIYSRFVF